MRLVAGAHPSYFTDPGKNRRFLELLGADERFGALELPVHNPADPLSWPHGAPEDWAAVVTQLPATKTAMSADPTFGLASTSVRGRSDALDLTRYTFQRVKALQESGHPVIAVELHSAPLGGGSVKALKDSLTHISRWNWGATRLVVEHCDAPRASHEPHYGFLELAEEIDAVADASRDTATRIGISLNWSRSVIETRSVNAGYAHLWQAKQSGLLSGMMFSSVCPEETPFGPAWMDAHQPPLGLPGAPKSSLLTPQIVQQCLDALPPELGFLGFSCALEGINTPAERAEAWFYLADLVT